MDTGRIVFGIIVGAAAGALVGILLAPDKGIETRRKMIRRGDDFAQNIKQHFHEFLDNVTSAINEAKQSSYTEESAAEKESATNPTAAF